MNKIIPPKSWLDLDNHYIEVLKNPWYKQLIELQNLISIETANFYNEKGILTLHLPITTGSISSPMGRGSDSSPVKVNLEGIDTYLADSMQFMLEYGCRLTEKGCYYIMPSFRGEKADKRHLCQFFHSEAEIKGDLNDVMNLVEEYIKYLSKKIIEKYGDKLLETLGDISHIYKLINSDIKRLTFNEVEKYFSENYKNINKYIIYEKGYRNLTKEAEQELVKKYEFVWVTNYDDLAVPFYQKQSGDNKTVKNGDLLMGIGETVGCGERHFDCNELLKALKRHRVDKKEYKWYFEMKKQFPIQTAGFGMGVERYLMWLLKETDIRDFQICLRFNGINILP
ncbi:MAG TPA: asparagine synthetase A [Bacilli bacterium]|nr:asparagine synthetase A [Bacilli bacterium]